MAELILKVGDTETYKDGDILCAFTDKHISCVHAQNICNTKNIGFKTNGLRDTASLTFKMFSEFYQYKFERVSNTEVKRILLSDSSFEVFSDKTEKQIYADIYIQRRLKHPTHLIFGESGSEVWFGGNSDFSQTKVDNVWSQITAFTGKLKEDHSLWPVGTAEPFDFLPIGLDSDLSDTEANELVAPITETQLVDGVGTAVIINHRTNFIQWQDMPLLSPLSIGKINNGNTSVDKREQYPINLLENVQVKNG